MQRLIIQKESGAKQILKIPLQHQMTHAYIYSFYLRTVQHQMTHANIQSFFLKKNLNSIK